MKWLRMVLVGCLIGFGASTFAKVSLANPSICKEAYRQDTVVKVSGSTINTEIPKNDQDRAKGLGGRSCLGVDSGMLFVFDKPDKYDFWMKDMKFPIDMVWIDENKSVTKVDLNVSPSTYPKTFTSETPSKYVLELSANRAQQLSITKGTNLNFSP
jgi:uncharacterized membrane protein (UPF0127 family)